MYTDALQCGVCSVCRKWFVFVFLFCVFVGILIYSDTATHCIQCMQLGCYAGLHKLWYPGIRDTSTWSKFRAHGEHGDVFLFSNLGAL